MARNPKTRKEYARLYERRKQEEFYDKQEQIESLSKIINERVKFYEVQNVLPVLVIKDQVEDRPVLVIERLEQ